MFGIVSELQRTGCSSPHLSHPESTVTSISPSAVLIVSEPSVGSERHLGPWHSPMILKQTEHIF